MPQTRRELLAASVATANFAALRLAMGDANDRDVAWLAEVQQIPKDAAALSPVLVDSNGRPITRLADWQTRRNQIRTQWLDFLGIWKSARPKPKLQVVAEDRPAGCVRQFVRYEAEPGDVVEGYLIRPAKTEARRVPGVAVFHSTVNHTIRQPAGLEGPPEYHFGLKLAQKGCVTFSPRCFLWRSADNYQSQVAWFEKRHLRSKGMAKMLWDAMVALDVLEAQPNVNPKRLGAVGHSLGAKEVLYLAAFDERVAATVSSEGGVGTRFSNWEAPWYLGPAIQAKDIATYEHHQLLALIAPRPFLLVGGDSADGAASWPFIGAALPVYRLYNGARIGLFNHKKGHTIPPEAERRIYDWLLTYLKA